MTRPPTPAERLPRMRESFEKDRSIRAEDYDEVPCQTTR